MVTCNISEKCAGNLIFLNDWRIKLDWVHNGSVQNNLQFGAEDTNNKNDYLKCPIKFKI